MIIRTILIALLALVASCSSSPNRLAKPSLPSKFTLEADAFTTWSVKTLQKFDYDGGLRKGQYIAIYEDAKGTFYQGPEKCMVLSQTHLPSQWAGGIWVPKDGNIKAARLWRYVVGMSPSERATSGVIVAAMDKMEEGNLQKIPMDLPDAILNKIQITH